LLGFLVCPPLGAGVAPGARGGGRDGESVEARHPVVPFSSRPVGLYAHDPRVRNLKPREAKEGGASAQSWHSWEVGMIVEGVGDG